MITFLVNKFKSYRDFIYNSIYIIINFKKINLLVTLCNKINYKKKINKNNIRFFDFYEKGNLVNNLEI